MQVPCPLPTRLKILADQLDSGEILADIGTDHAYLPIYAVQNHIVKRAIACDIHRPPLQSALFNIQKFNVTNQVECRMGSGLSVLLETEIDLISMAGLGGMTIRSILSEDYEKAKKAKSILLQPNNHEADVRLWLASSGFKILDEGVLRDRKHFYQWMKVKWNGEIRDVDSFSAHYGDLQNASMDPVRFEWLTKERNRLSKALQGREKAKILKSSVSEQYEDTIVKIDRLLKNNLTSVTNSTILK